MCWYTSLQQSYTWQSSTSFIVAFNISTYGNELTHCQFCCFVIRKSHMYLPYFDQWCHQTMSCQLPPPTQPSPKILLAQSKAQTLLYNSDIRKTALGKVYSLSRTCFWLLFCHLNRIYRFGRTPRHKCNLRKPKNRAVRVDQCSVHIIRHI